VLFKKESALGKYVKVGDIMFKVVGVNSKKERWGNGNAYIPFTTAQLIYNPDRKFHSIAMTVNGLETTEANEAFSEKLKTNMAKSLNYDPNDTQALHLRNAQRDYVETMKIFGGITIFVSIIGIFTLIAGIVGVSNIMLVSVKERTREIGIRKAIGAPPASILRSIIIESILITAIFGYIGMMFGIGLTEFINFVMEQAAAGNPDDKNTEVLVVHDIETALNSAEYYNDNNSEIFIIGGGSLYQSFMMYCHRLYITRIYKDFEGDTFFPEIEETSWKLIWNEKHTGNEFDYEYQIYNIKYD
jgi:ABC-type antimicrobial peptide transport system permease subunit